LVEHVDERVIQDFFGQLNEKHLDHLEAYLHLGARIQRFLIFHHFLRVRYQIDIHNHVNLCEEEYDYVKLADEEVSPDLMIDLG
jgi:hypothetical protein